MNPSEFLLVYMVLCLILPWPPRGVARPTSHFLILQRGAVQSVSCFRSYLKKTLTISTFAVPDAPPDSIQARGTNTTVITVRWLPVPSEQTNGIILGYQLSLFNESGNFMKNVSINNVVELYFEIDGLEVWTNYSTEMRAYTAKGYGPWSKLLLTATDEQGKELSSKLGMENRIVMIVCSYSVLLIRRSIGKFKRPISTNVWKVFRFFNPIQRATS